MHSSMAQVVLMTRLSPPVSPHFMQCTSCRVYSDNLREFSRVIDLGDNRKTIDTIFLCAACRVINAINPKYVYARVHNGSKAASANA